MHLFCRIIVYARGRVDLPFAEAVESLRWISSGGTVSGWWKEGSGFHLKIPTIRVSAFYAKLFWETALTLTRNKTMNSPKHYCHVLVRCLYRVKIWNLMLTSSLALQALIYNHINIHFIALLPRQMLSTNATISSTPSGSWIQCAVFASFVQ